MASIITKYHEHLDACIADGVELTPVATFLRDTVVKYDIEHLSELTLIHRVVSALKCKTLTSLECMDQYKKSVSIFQSEKSKSGKVLEDDVSDMLSSMKIEHTRQACIDNKGCITDDGPVMCKLDFLIGKYEVGKHISDYCVLSCKTTCRERWTQDNWTMQHKPKLYCLFTKSSDYPSSERFQENDSRVIITTKPKKRKDDRIRKLSFGEFMKLLPDDRRPVCPQHE